LGSRRLNTDSFINFINSINLQSLIQTTFIFPSTSKALLFRFLAVTSKARMFGAGHQLDLHLLPVNHRFLARSSFFSSS
jgi:hypothetical protein